jgi:eukaryotic-like serine/threonine-protein kinase
MKPERWQQVDELLEAALECPTTERASFLDRACAGDEELRRELESLLVSDGQAQAFIESVPARMAADLFNNQSKLGAGERIAHYEILGQLGSGGMGEVYLAKDTKLDRNVAIKLLPPELIVDEHAKKRLLREAKAAAKLDHPNICAIYEVNEEAGRSFIVMQHIEGETLASRIHRKSVQLHEALDVSVQVADALAVAHSRGVIHRDIKPANIIVTPQGQVKVLDFGLAKVVQDKALSHSQAETASLLTQPGVIVGTVPYMSPEQVKGEAIDVRSDIFSFGAFLYEMVSGKQPFVGENAASTISAILTQKPPPLSRYADVPPELQRIAHKCLEKDKENRYQSARELVIDLKSLKRSSETGIPNLERMARRRGKYRWLYAAVALLALAISVSIALYVFRSTPSAKPISSLAVLPFTNGSPEPNAEFLSDGVTESLINSLTQISQLKVTARTTAFRYKGKEIDPQVLGRDLNVDAVLTGKVTKQGDSFYVQADLVNTADGTQLWGERYSRNLSDILAVQDEIATRISERLRLTLTQHEKERLTKSYTDNTEAYQLYIQGRYYWNKRTDEGLKQSLEYFQRAINLDPDYALAYVGLADSYNFLGAFGLGVLPPMEAHPKARTAAMSALTIDNALAEAHTSLAFVMLYYDWDRPTAEREYKQAIDANPKYALAHQWYSHLLMASGRTNEAISKATRALELEPASLSTNMNLSWQFYFARQYEQAIAGFKKTLDLDPGFTQVLWALGRTYAQKQMFNESTKSLQQAVSLSGGSPVYISALGYTHAVSGNKEKAQKTLEDLKRSGRYVSPYWIALLYGGLGNNEAAFEWLEKAYLERSGGLVWLATEPQWDNVRSDLRFQDLLRKVNFK